MPLSWSGRRSAAATARINVGGAVLWGLAATTLLTSLMRGLQAGGVTRMDLPLMLGTMVSPDRDRAKLIGFIMQFVGGFGFAFIYAAIFQSLRRTSAPLGALLGMVHGAFVLTAALPILPGIHPRMASEFSGPEPTASLEPPGFMASNYGRGTPVVTMVAHVLFGAILGAFYRLRESDSRQPEEPRRR